MVKVGGQRKPLPVCKLRSYVSAYTIETYTIADANAYISGTSQASWKPNALRPVTLITAIMIACALITISQILLVRSQTDGGVIIAATIDDFTLAQSFLYRYLPTIIALVFSIFWNWIDLQTKRIEPYYQLSKPDGAWGKDSLLISYPFDFLPFVPMSALRSR